MVELAGLLSVLSCALVATAANVTNLGKPLSVPASQYWDGKDGPWSTFRIEIGTPPQQIRVLPASSQSSSWVILPEACTSSTISDCAPKRGRTYLRNESSTWTEYGPYELNTFIQKRVGLNGDGLYGYEKLTLGWAGDAGPTLDRQMVAGIISEDFYLASLALNPRPNNFTDFNNPIPSLIQSLRNSTNPIPSNAWSYTAGAHNLAPKVFGSLVLGGYDATRFQRNDVVFPFGADISLDFQVAIQSIKTNLTDKTLLSSGIIAYIDTLVADIWLPTRTCELFEEAFGLVWNEKTELYLMNDTLHESLLRKNPSVSFQLGPQVSGPSVTIQMPYFNFYHTATSAYVGNSSGLYFPLKRAANDTQYILGRTFLQSAYLSADYDRNVFNLSQALYPSSTSSANVVAILPPRNSDSNNNNNNGSPISKGGLSTGAIVGVALGGVVVFVIAAAAAFIFYRRKKKSKSGETHELGATHENSPRHEVPANELKYEVGEGLRHEVTGDSHQKAELDAGGDQQKPVEADGIFRAEVDGDAHPIYEMPADSMKKYVEMEGEGHLRDKPEAYLNLPSRRPTNASEHSEVIPYDDMSPLTPPADGRRHG